MALDLKDFRGKITVETDCVLEALNRATGEDRASIARDVLHKWALDQIRVHSVLGRLMRAEGLVGESEGMQAASQGLPAASEGMPAASKGVPMESRGASGSGRDYP